MSKTNNIEEQDKLNENQNLNFNKEDDIQISKYYISF